VGGPERPLDSAAVLILSPFSIRTGGALILMLAYGYSVGPGKDPLVELVDTAVGQFGQGTEPGAFLVDVFPSLRYVPAWFPGAGWKRTGELFKQTLSDMAEVPFRFVQEQMVRRPPANLLMP
jgi:hypothetical protein